MSRREQLAALTEHLHPDLADEITRLFATEAVLESAQRDRVELARRNHELTVVNGDLRQRLVRAQARLEQLDADEITTARRAAFFVGTAWLRVTSLGRGQYRTEHIAPERVTVHAD